MLFDVLNTFCEAEDTGDTGTNLLGDVIDLGDGQDRDIGAGKQVFINALVDTAIAAATGGTYKISVVTSDNENMSSADVLIESPEFDAGAGIAEGEVLLNAALPSDGYKRYLGVREIVGTENTTAGKVTVFLSHDQRAYRAYKDGDN